MIGLLACTGLRIGEALRLDREDVDPAGMGADGPRLEVRQITRGAAAPQHRARARRVRGDPRPALPQPTDAELLHHHARDPARAPHDLPAVPRAAGAGRRAHPSPSGPFGFTICAIPLLSERCWAGIATVTMSRRGCRCCPPIWGMWTRPRRIGICQRRRSCSRSRPSGSSRRRDGHDRARADARGVLHPPVDQREGRQPAHDQRLPRHVPAATPLRATAHRQAAVQAPARGPRRTVDRRVPRSPRARPPTTALAPATPDWPRSTRCSATPR